MHKPRKNNNEDILTFSLSKLSPSLLCHSDMQVAYLQEQLGGQRASELGTHTRVLQSPWMVFYLLAGKSALHIIRVLQKWWLLVWDYVDSSFDWVSAWM